VSTFTCARCGRTSANPTDADEGYCGNCKAFTGPFCVGCGRRPHEIGVYVDCAATEEITPDEYVRREEGTYNPATGHFLCDECYIRAGMPVGTDGRWVAP
jgi:hypothetical protein